MENTIVLHFNLLPLHYHKQLLASKQVKQEASRMSNHIWLANTVLATFVLDTVEGRSHLNKAKYSSCDENNNYSSKS